MLRLKNPDNSRGFFIDNAAKEINADSFFQAN